MPGSAVSQLQSLIEEGKVVLVNETDLDPMNRAVFDASYRNLERVMIDPYKPNKNKGEAFSLAYAKATGIPFFATDEMNLQPIIDSQLNTGMADQNQIRHFTSLLWKNVQDLLGKDLTAMVYTYHEEGDYMVPLSLYCDALLHYQQRCFPKLKTEEKLQFFELCLYDIIDSEALLSDPSDYADSYARYEKCRKSLNKKEKLPIFPEKDLFYDQLDKTFPAENPLYENTFDAFLEKTYGHADDDLTDW